MDVSPKQIISVSASLIPFLEHDDANRALMGSNMQRQAVPLISPEPPRVGTGMEGRTAYDSGRRGDRQAGRGGHLRHLLEIRIKPDEAKREEDVYTLLKYQRTNQDTCYTQKPIVAAGPARRRRRGDRGRPGHLPGRAGAWDGTSCARSCPGTGTTTRTPSSFRRRWSRTTRSAPSTSRSSPSRSGRRSSDPRRSPATSPTRTSTPSSSSTRRGSSAWAPRVKAGSILVGKVTPEERDGLHPRVQAAELDIRREGQGGARHLAARAPRRGGDRSSTCSA